MLVEEKPLCFTVVLYSFFIKTLISEVTERIPFILSHNVWSRYNLIMHHQKLVDLYTTEISHKNPQKWAFRRPEFDIRWRITLRRNFTSTIAALVQYEGPSSVNAQKSVNFDPKMND